MKCINCINCWVEKCGCGK